MFALTPTSFDENYPKKYINILDGKFSGRESDEKLYSILKSVEAKARGPLN